jgi:hypothetical protein
MTAAALPAPVLAHVPRPHANPFVHARYLVPPVLQLSARVATLAIVAVVAPAAVPAVAAHAHPRVTPEEEGVRATAVLHLLDVGLRMVGGI